MMFLLRRWMQSRLSMTNRFRHLSSPNFFDLERQSTSEDEFYETVGTKPRSRIRRSWETLSGTKTLDPGDPFLVKWNKIFVFACFLAISLDPLFFYIPVIDKKNVCLKLDQELQTTVCFLRTVIDVLYTLRIIFHCRTGFVLRVFIVDILSILPVPQMVVLAMIPKLSGLAPLYNRSIMEIVIFVQYVPRTMRIYPLFKEVTSSSGIIASKAWAAALFSLHLSFLACHVVGAVWYLLSIERGVGCWRDACKNNNSCISSNLYCGAHKNDTYTYLLDQCAFVEPEDSRNVTQLDFGIFAEALASGVTTDSTDFPDKFMYCFWWGFHSVSSMGQNLKTSTSASEILFAFFISIAGLVLFAVVFIGNMQNYLQSLTERVVEMRVNTRDAELWMSRRALPHCVRERIRQHEQYKWQKTRGVEEQALIRSFPKDVRRDINRCLCFGLIKRVPLFAELDEQILDAICDCLKPVFYTNKSWIIREGDPVDEMLFINRGKLESITTNGGTTDFYSAACLKPGDFYGVELLTWALDPHSSSILPISTRTVITLSEVEGFALAAEDLKSVALQFRLVSNYNFRHLSRFYSVQWRRWACCFIQSAWRRYWKHKQVKLLQPADLRRSSANEAATKPSLGATLYASSFAAKMLQNIQQNRACSRKFPLRHQQLLPSKPSEPICSPHGNSRT